MEIDENRKESVKSCPSSEVKKSKRFRNGAKSKSIVQDEFERNDSFSNSDDSEDEWNESRKKGKRTKKTAPKQTLKHKLLEKTRMLQQLSKLSSVSIPRDGCGVKQINILINSPVDREEKLHRTTTEMPSRTDSKKAITMTFEDTKPSIDKLLKCDSSTKIENVECDSLAPDIKIKNESNVKTDSRIPPKLENQHIREPIVIEYSINRSQISEVDAPCTAFSQSYMTPDCNSNPPHQALPLKMNLYSISSPAKLMKDSAGEILSSHSSSKASDVSNASADNSRCVSKASIPQLPSNVNFRVSSSNPPNETPAKRCRAPKSKSSRASFLQKELSGINCHRTSSITQSNCIRIVKNLKINDSTISRSKKVFQNRRNECANRVTKPSNSKISIETSTAPSTYSCFSLKTNANSLFNKVGNISPNGTVIHTGTGSVTITPRKVVPEKPPVQRKLYKNEIEGTISCRNIEGALRYVVNLANGTYIPLSDLQVEKLREQHKGALPIKLKIPVPCDVADKIEPSFLIED